MALGSANLQGLPDKAKEGLEKLLGEIGRLKLSVVDGAGANTNIAVTGIKTDDTIVGVTRFELDEEKVKGITALTDVTIASNGNVKSATATTGDKLQILWFDKEA